MFKIRKDVGLSEFISLGALIVSAFAYYHSTLPEGGHIIHGSGTVYSTVIKGDECTYALTIPVEFHNSGKQAVTLEQLAPTDTVPLVVFSNQKSILEKSTVAHRIYLSNTNIGVIPSFWIKNFENQNEFEPSYKHIGDLIQPAESYRLYVVLFIEPYSQLSSASNVSVFIKFNAIFGNEQNIPISAAIEIDGYDANKCS